MPEIHSDICEMPEGDIFEKLLCGNFITNSSVVLRKEIFEKFGGYNSDLLTCEDWDFWLRISSIHEIGVCPEPLLLGIAFMMEGKVEIINDRPLPDNESLNQF